MKTNGAIKIDQGIPPPTNEQDGRGKYPWSSMKIGDSFAVLPPMNPHAVRCSAIIRGQRHGGKYIVRKTDDGYRCWRVE